MFFNFKILRLLVWLVLGWTGVFSLFLFFADPHTHA